MFKLRRYLKDYKKQLIIGPVFKLFEAILELIVPLVMSDIIDSGIKSGSRSYVITHGIIMVSLSAIGLCSALICQASASVASQGFGTKLRNALFRHINTLSYAELDKLGTPTLITRMTSDVNQLQLAVAMLIRLVIRAPFLIVGAMIMAFAISPALSVIFMLAAMLIGLVLYTVMSKSVTFYKIIQKKLDRISLLARENLSGNRVIRAFCKQTENQSKFNAASDEYVETGISVGKLSALLDPLTYIIANTAIIFIVWFSGKAVYAGNLHQGQIIALVSYMTQILLTMIVFANLVVIFTKASASAARVNEVFELSPSVKEKNTETISVVKNSKTPKIEFDGVCFSYAGDEYDVKNISFKIMRGQRAGIIGGTGSGKSTVVNLMPRFYDCRQGRVMIDGIDVREYPLKQLRAQFGIVPQRAVLFSGTIASNMRWKNKNATDDEIISALKTAQAWEFVEKLPDGINSPVNQGGKNFSGGQRQRLTIARALIDKPEILILDDSSSALDYATDARLRQAISELDSDMNVIIVSQRVSSIKDCDVIIVLDNGEIIGSGTHEELLSTCDEYRAIYESQHHSEEVRS